MTETVNSVNNQNVDIRNRGNLIEPLTESINFNKDFDVAKPQDNFVNIKFKFNAVSVSSNYTAAREDTYIGVDTNQEIQITLYEGQDNDRLIIKDEIGNARRRPIKVLPSGSDTIEDHNELKMQINNIAIQFLSINGVWRLI